MGDSFLSDAAYFDIGAGIAYTAAVFTFYREKKLWARADRWHKLPSKTKRKDSIEDHGPEKNLEAWRRTTQAHMQLLSQDFKELAQPLLDNLKAGATHENVLRQHLL